MKQGVKYLQMIGQSLMLPVSVLPAAGLLLRLGEKDLLNMPAVQAAAQAVFANLPLLFAVGTAIGFSEGQAVAALAAVVGQLVMLAALKAINPVIDMGVFSGIVMGIIAAVLCKRFSHVRLPAVLGFFGGKRFVPFVTAVVGVVLAFVFQAVWPALQQVIDAVGQAAVQSSAGPALFAAGKRLLIPVGLHHVYYPVFLYQFGQFTDIDGAVIRGDFNRYYAGDPSAGIFMASEFPIMMFGLPAAALAMYLNARPARKKFVAGLMVSGALTSFLTGITEPVEFAFIFAAPLLFVFHVLMAALSGWLTSIFDIHLGFTFTASFIDYVLSYRYGHNQLLLWPIGLVIGVLYFVVFHLAIRKFDLPTPGREVDDTPLTYDDGLMMLQPQRILAALGGADNIEYIDACISRLRVTVHQRALVNKKDLLTLGAAGISEVGNNLQLVFGTPSDELKEAISRYLPPLRVTSAAEGAYTRHEHEADKVMAAASADQPSSAQQALLQRLMAPIGGCISQREAIEARPGYISFTLSTPETELVAPINGVVELIDVERSMCRLRVGAASELVLTVLTGEVIWGTTVFPGQKIQNGQLLARLNPVGADMSIKVTLSGCQAIRVTPAEEVSGGEDVLAEFLVTI